MKILKEYNFHEPRYVQNVLLLTKKPEKWMYYDRRMVLWADAQTDGRTDRPTDRPTDRVTFRVAKHATKNWRIHRSGNALSSGQPLVSGQSRLPPWRTLKKRRSLAYTRLDLTWLLPGRPGSKVSRGRRGRKIKRLKGNFGSKCRFHAYTERRPTTKFHQKTIISDQMTTFVNYQGNKA